MNRWHQSQYLLSSEWIPGHHQLQQKLPGNLHRVSISTVESRFLKPPRETIIGSRNMEFEKSKVASKDAKLQRYLPGEIMHIFIVIDGR